MNGEPAADMDAAWRRYLAKRDADPLRKFGFNPRLVFYAGWLARSSGWSGTEEAFEDD